MNDAELYENNNQLQRRDAKRILREFADRLKWSKDGRDRLLDVGCGSGNVLVNMIRPLLPFNFEQILGTDKSIEMIEFASKKYENIERCSFRILDITTSQIPNEFHEQFDHVTSFYCFHWIREQRKALENIYKLLRTDGGDCLFVFVVRSLNYDIYPTMQNSSKWSAYLKDLPEYMPTLYYSKDPVGEYTELLHQVGFVNCKVELEKNFFTYEGLETMKANMRAVSPFMSRLSSERLEEFMNDFAQTVENLGWCEWNADMTDKNVIFPYQTMVVYAQKPYVTA